MKTKLLLTSLMSFIFISSFAQDKTTVNATSSEISDNLDLRAVASLFGDSKDLEDFEFRLNDPKAQISNLDLNNDNQVDYLRVIETTEGNAHIIVIQSVLGNEQFQDVASVEVEKDSNNQVQVQVVGDVYMYGTNYIYEPVYVNVPVIYSRFWVSNYRPYYSSWYWGYYPSYYTYWSPFPVFKYRNHIGVSINFNFQYNYVSHRRCSAAYNNYYGRRGNYYERQYPTRSFSQRNSGFGNRHELDKSRPSRAISTSPTRNSNNTRENATTRTNAGINGTTSNNVRTNGGTRQTSTGTTRINGGSRNTATTRTTTGTRATTSPSAPTRNTTTRNTPSSTNSVRKNIENRVKTNTNQSIRSSGSVRNNTPRNETTRSASPSRGTSVAPTNGNNSSRITESNARNENVGRR